MTERYVLVIIWWALHIVAGLLITLHSLRRRRNASSTLMWIFIAWSFPVLGPLFYLSFGIDRVPERGHKKFTVNQRLLRTRQSSQANVPDASWNQLTHIEPSTPFQRHVNRTLDALLPDHPPLAGNHIAPLLSGDEAYPKMLAAIRSAQHHIHLQSFIIGNDATGREFMDALAERAQAGVHVRLLYDRFGSTSAHLFGLFRTYRNIPNLHIAGWTQANFLKKQFQINLRNHRKSLIIDGQLGFFGGINIHLENTATCPTGPIRDYHFEISGPLVHELQYAFLRDWHFITAEQAEQLLTASLFPTVHPAGDITARLISSGPVTGSDIAVETLFSGITQAQKQIIAVTPYLVPPAEILRALRSAALRGLDVQLIVPQHNNHFYTGLASRALYEELLQSGIQIFERPPPFIHAKAMLIDGECALIGTANLDERSLHLNYETTAVVYSEPFVAQMSKILRDEIALSIPVDLDTWQQRPAGRRLLENLATLMNPVL